MSVQMLVNLLERERAEVKRLKEVIRSLHRHLGESSRQWYDAQNEIELLRVIRKSQGEGITKLRQQLAEACKERDAASVRNEGLRKQLFGVQEDNERIKIELRYAREVTNMGAIRYCDVCRERDAWRQEVLNLEVRLHGLELDCNCRIVYSNPVEAMKADELRRDNSRNVDNQKAYEAPNCPSS